MSRILLGANYYPEDWDESEIDRDIEKMTACGFNVVRIAEFAWSRMEPEEGRYTFDWLHRVVDKLRAAGIGVIMGTPTATSPRWLTKKYPEMTMLLPTGVRTDHGGRRHCCSENPEYLACSAKIVEKLAREFGSDEGVIGWQIDNEIYHWSIERGCCCEHCMAAFHRHLAEKYGSAEGVNRAWNLSHSLSHQRFVHMQAEIIRKYSSAPIGTDTMPFNGFDYRELNAPLDVAQFNYYATDLESKAMWMDYMRKFSKLPFWNTETQAAWNGSTAQGHPLQKEGFVYLNTWMPIMLGGEAILYWLWRTHWAGHELMHGAVLDTSGRYTYANGEIRKAAEEFKKVQDFLPEYKVTTDTAMLFTSLNWNIKLTQDVSAGLKSEQGLADEFHKAILACGIHPDVIDAKEELSGYKLIFTPTAFTLEEHDFPRRIADWVKNGGVWVTGPMTDIRTNIGTKYKNSPYGCLETITEETLAYILPDDNGLLTLENGDGEEVRGSLNYELFEAGDYAPLLTVKSGHSALVGKSVSFVKQVGKGFVVVLGTMPEEAELLRIIRKAASLAEVQPYDTDRGIMITRRCRGEDTLLIAAAVGGEAGQFRFDGVYTDLLTGETFEQAVNLAPYELRILKRR